MTSPCTAKVYVEEWVQDGDTLTTTFLVQVDECPRSQGSFDYVVTYELSTGGTSQKRWTGSWPWQDTTGPVYATDQRTFSEKVVSVAAIEEATRCVCSIEVSSSEFLWPGMPSARDSYLRQVAFVRARMEGASHRPDYANEVLEEPQSISMALYNLVVYESGYETSPRGYRIHNLFRDQFVDIGCSHADGKLAFKRLHDEWRPAMNARLEWISCNLAFENIRLVPIRDVQVRVVTETFPIAVNGRSETRINCSSSDWPDEPVTTKVEVVATEEKRKQLIIKRGRKITKKTSLSLSLPLKGVQLGGGYSLDEETTFSSEEMSETLLKVVRTESEQRTVTVRRPARTKTTVRLRNEVVRKGVSFSGYFEVDASFYVHAAEPFGLAGDPKRVSWPAREFRGGELSSLRDREQRILPIAGVVWLGLENQIVEVMNEEAVSSDDCGE